MAYTVECSEGAVCAALATFARQAGDVEAEELARSTGQEERNRGQAPRAPAGGSTDYVPPRHGKYQPNVPEGVLMPPSRPRSARAVTQLKHDDSFGG